MNNPIPTQPVYLDPEYTGYKAGAGPIKFSTLYEVNARVMTYATLWVGIAGVVLVLSLGYLVSSVYQMSSEAEAKGVFVRCETRQLGPVGTRYFAHVTYEADFMTYEQAASVSREDCQRFSAGDAVDLRVNRSHPEQVRLAEDNSTILLLVALFAFIAYGVGRSQYQILRGNQRARIRWCALDKAKHVLDGRVFLTGTVGRNLVVDYEFVNPSGHKQLGRMVTSDPKLVKRLPLLPDGAPVKVLYTDDSTHIML